MTTQARVLTPREARPLHPPRPAPGRTLTLRRALCAAGHVLGGDEEDPLLQAGGLLAQPLAHRAHVGVEAVPRHPVVQGQLSEFGLLPAGSQAAARGKQPHGAHPPQPASGGCCPGGAKSPLPSTDELPSAGLVSAQLGAQGLAQHPLSGGWMKPLST